MPKLVKRETLTHEFSNTPEFIVEENGDLTWWQKMATENEVNIESLSKRLDRIPNQKVLWRHDHPYKEECRQGDKLCDIYGHVDEAKIEVMEGKQILYGKMRIENETPKHVELMDKVQHPKKYGYNKMGSSIAYVEYDDGRVYLEEVSITPWPKCPTCLTPSKENIVLKKIGEKEMTEAEDKTAIEKMTSSLKEYEKTIKEMETLIDEKEARVTELENLILENGKVVKEMEDTITKQKTKIKEQDARIVYLEEKAPIIAEITQKEDEIPKYAELSTEMLKLIRDKVKANTKAGNIQIHNMEDDMEDNQDGNPMKSLKKLSPKLFREMENLAKARGKNMKDFFEDLKK